ncbi:helix-turn-helix transcriptional regulator [Ornithinibacillus gellani]|uniref:helix-turn-helix domain-containing protein n=1 Tax=Ornithinibacillus gellani TaxID=2293253 RepID=UPI000F49C8C5|nr:helix-turn-helix transcriptional regulator [Ornithinibacillus gellani]TQS75316.1 helix-turn-helix transcriptional regulator [Ornithinibacillus gellani]
MDGKRLGRRVKAFRKLKGYTQIELAKELDVSVTLLGAVERGTKDAPDALLEQIAATLDIDMAELLLRNEE